MKTDRVLYELFLLLIYSCSMIKPGQTNQAGDFSNTLSEKRSFFTKQTILPKARSVRKIDGKLKNKINIFERLRLEHFHKNLWD